MISPPVRQAIWEFEAKNGRLPAAGNADEAKAVFDAATALAPEPEKPAKAADGEGEEEEAAAEAPHPLGEDKETLETLSHTVAGNLNPMAAIFGGVTAQEVIKAAGSKFTPIKQWFMYEAANCLTAIPSDAAPIGSRYDGQVCVCVCVLCLGAIAG